jgi:VIT1/CCC1 family predicted Fe2+/Mn2+ transporter
MELPGPKIGPLFVRKNNVAKETIEFVGETLSLGDRLSELLYGVLMVTSISGLVLIGEPGGENDLYYMLVVLFITIVMWGLLDGISYALLSSANRAERETLLESLQAESDSDKRNKAIVEDLDETLISRLDDESKSQIAAIVGNGLPRNAEKMTKNKLTSYEKDIVLAAFLLDFIPLIILVFPYLFFDSVKTAALTSHIIALVMFVVLGYYYSKYAHLNKWKGAFVCGLLGLILVVFAESTNLVLI